AAGARSPRSPRSRRKRPAARGSPPLRQRFGSWARRLRCAARAAACDPTPELPQDPRPTRQPDPRRGRARHTVRDQARVLDLRRGRLRARLRRVPPAASSEPMTTVDDCRIIDLPKIFMPEGSITPVEGASDLVPFEIERVFYLYDVVGGAVRGGHAHKVLE